MKTYRAIIPPWKLTSIKWPCVSRTIGLTVATFVFQSGNRRLIVTTA